MATATRARTTRTASLDMMVGEVLDRKKDELGRGVDAEKERDCRHCWFLSSGIEACLYGGEVDAHSVSTPQPTVNKKYSILAT